MDLFSTDIAITPISNNVRYKHHNASSAEPSHNKYIVLNTLAWLQLHTTFSTVYGLL